MKGQLPGKTSTREEKNLKVDLVMRLLFIDEQEPSYKHSTI